MIAFISSSVILEKPARPEHVGHRYPAWMSSIGPLRNASATIAFASLAFCRRRESMLISLPALSSSRFWHGLAVLIKEIELAPFANRAATPGEHEAGQLRCLENLSASSPRGAMLAAL